MLAATPPPHLVEIAPNCSLSWRQALWFYAWVCTASLSIAGLLAWRGFWPVLPFAGLELAVLGAALWVSMQRGRYREVILVYPHKVVVEKGVREGHTAVEFPLHWARVTLRPAPLASFPSQLLISSHGRSCEIGRCLTESEREGLRSRLEQLIGGVDQTPVCAGADASPAQRIDDRSTPHA